MGVVINEFEVVAEPTPSTETVGMAAAPSMPPVPSARDIERVVSHRAERLARVWAH